MFRAFSVFDMPVHNPSGRQACEAMDLTRTYNDLLEQLMSLPHPNPHERGHSHADFGHLVSGYDAGYYSYLAYVNFSLQYNRIAGTSANPVVLMSLPPICSRLRSLRIPVIRLSGTIIAALFSNREAVKMA